MRTLVCLQRVSPQPPGSCHLPGSVLYPVPSPERWIALTSSEAVTEGCIFSVLLLSSLQTESPSLLLLVCPYSFQGTRCNLLIPLDLKRGIASLVLFFRRSSLQCTMIAQLARGHVNTPARYRRTCWQGGINLCSS